jgi:hypothetical protein
MALNNNYKVGNLDTLVHFYDREKNHGSINSAQTITAKTTIRAAIKDQERWKATESRDDIHRILMLECRYYAEINTAKTVIEYNSKTYKVRDIEIIGRRQFLKITAIQDQ